MPFEQKYDAAIREAAIARVLERLATNPKDRHVLRIVSDEFNVGQQSLRMWVAAAESENETPTRKKRRPRFSPVVTTRIPMEPMPEETPLVPPAAAVETMVPVHDDRVARLEEQAAALRQGNQVLKEAMRVLLDR
jgi:transposase-like protein